MYVGLKQPRGDGERYVTPARAAAKETTLRWTSIPSRGSRSTPGRVMLKIRPETTHMWSFTRLKRAYQS